MKIKGILPQLIVVVGVAIFGGIYIVANSVSFTDQINGFITYLYSICMMATFGLMAIANTDLKVRGYYLSVYIICVFVISIILAYSHVMIPTFLATFIIAAIYIIITKISPRWLDAMIGNQLDSRDGLRKFIDQILLVSSVSIPVFLLLGSIFKLL